MRRTITLVEEYEVSPDDYGTNDPHYIAELDAANWAPSERDWSMARVEVEILDPEMR
jgi:hypothetical protein